MKFKDEECETQFGKAPHKLQEIVTYFDSLCHEFGNEAVVTRVLTPVHGDSGVHEAHRGVDCRDQVGETYMFTPDQVNYITTTMNNMYPRDDGKIVCIHHSFAGGPMHFHCQIPYSWLKPDEIAAINKGE